MNKYYFKLVLIVLGILSFNIDMLNANAKSATCVYQDGAVGIEVSIDENYEISHSNKTTLTGGWISAVNVTSNDFISPDNPDEFYCREKIYYWTNGTSGYTFSYVRGPAYWSLNLVEEEIDNDSPTEDEPKTIVRTYNYGSNSTGYTVNYFNDGTYTASGLGNRSSYTTQINDSYENFENGCPEHISVIEAANTASIYFESNVGNNYYLIDRVATPEDDTGADENTNTEQEAIPIIEVNFCEQNGVRMTFRVIGYVLFIAKILIPLLLIILGTIDFVKATLSSSDKAPQEALGAFARRIIIAIIIFLIPTILNLVLSLVDGAYEAFEDSKFTDCTNCLFSPFDKCDVENMSLSQ